MRLKCLSLTIFIESGAFVRAALDKVPCQD